MAVAACSGPSTAPTTTSSTGLTPTPSPPATRTGHGIVVDGSASPSLDTRDAGPATNHVDIVTTVVGDRGDDGTRGVRALGAAGTLLVDVGPPVETGRALPVIGQSTVEAWTGSAHQVLRGPNAIPGDKPSQVYAGHLCGSPPVWMETHSVELEHADWRAWVRLPGSTKPKVLISSEDLVPRRDPPPPPDEGNLSASSSVVYWPITMSAGGTWHAAIAGASLAGKSRARVVVEDALYPQVDQDDGLLYIREPRVDESVPATEFEVRRRAEQTDSLVARVQITAKSAVEAFACDQGRYAVVVSDPPRGSVGLVDRATLVVWGEGVDDVVRVRLHDRAAALRMSGHLVTWGNGAGNYDGGQYVLDLRDRSLYQVHANKGLSYVYTCEGYVGWTDFPSGKPNGPANFVLARWK